MLVSCQNKKGDLLMLNENDFVDLFQNADDEVKNQIEKALVESQQHSELED